MAQWTPDPTFYPSPRLATRAPAEKLAYVAEFDPDRKKPDRLAVVDLDPKSSSYAQILNRIEVGTVGDELHHFGWNACSSCLCPNAPHPHVERRYLIVPGLRSSNIHVLDTKPDPKAPKLVKTVKAAELAERADYSRPHTVHCGPDGIYVTALGNAAGKGPGGIFLMDHETFEIRGRWEIDRGPQQFAYDMWWHLGHDTVVTSEWGTPDMVENGLIPEMILRCPVRPPAPLLGPAQAQAPAGDRLRRRVPDGVRAAAGPRPDQSLRLRQLRAVARGPVVLDLDLVPRRRQVGGQEGDHDPGRARRGRRRCRRCSRASRRCRRWSPTSISRSTTSTSTSPAGGPATSTSTTCPTR